MGGKLGHHSSTEPAGDKNKTNTEDSASSLTKYPCRDKHPIKCQQAASFSAEFKCQAREREREGHFWKTARSCRRPQSRRRHSSAPGPLLLLQTSYGRLVEGCDGVKRSYCFMLLLIASRDTREIKRSADSEC